MERVERIRSILALEHVTFALVLKEGPTREVADAVESSIVARREVQMLVADGIEFRLDLLPDRGFGAARADTADMAFNSGFQFE